METPHIPEKPKRKNDFATLRGHPKFAYATMFVASLVLVFFRLDVLIGAVRLRLFYMPVGFGLILLSTLVILGICHYWGMSRRYWQIPIVGIYLGVTICGGWLIGAFIISLLPTWMPVILVGLTAAQWWRARKAYILTRRLLLYTGLFVFFSINYVLGTGWLMNASVADGIYVADKYYVLLFKREFYGNRWGLYSCNQLALACREIAYDSAPINLLDDKNSPFAEWMLDESPITIDLQLDTTSNRLIIRVNNEIVKDYLLPKK